MSFTVNLTKNDSETHPENLHKLVDWVRVETAEYNSLCEYLSRIVVDKPMTYETLEALWELKTEHQVSLTNSNRRIAGEKHILMCGTLSFIYDRAYRALDDLLSETSRTVAKGNFKLADGGSTLLAGYTGKCHSHSYQTLEKRGSLDCSCSDTWDGKYLTYRQIFTELRRLTEEAANSLPVA